MHNISQVLINYKVFVFLQKSALCDAYFLYHAIIIFHCKFPPRPLFSACIITPVNFIDTFHVLMSNTLIPYLRFSVTHEVYMYQLTSSQTHKMAMKNSQRWIFLIIMKLFIYRRCKFWLLSHVFTNAEIWISFSCCAVSLI